MREARRGIAELWNLLSAGVSLAGTAELAEFAAANRRALTPSFRTALIARTSSQLYLPTFCGFRTTARATVIEDTPVAPASRDALLHAPRQSSLHHLPVRSVCCQLGCLDMWQKHHETAPCVFALLIKAVPARPSATAPRIFDDRLLLGIKGSDSIAGPFLPFPGR